MSEIHPLAKMLREGLVEMRCRLDAAEGKAEELQRQLNVAHEALRGAREAFAEAEETLSPTPPPHHIANGCLGSMFRHGPDVEEALLIIREALVALEVAP